MSTSSEPRPEAAHCKPQADCLPSASWKTLELRAALLARVRQFFARRDFLEVETPLLSADTVVDRYLDPLEVTLPHDPRRPSVGRRMWLQTSPEFGMKRLMAAGGRAIYQVTRAMRAGEQGPLHNAEFTIVEWYRRGDSMTQGMELLADFAAELLQRGAPELVSYADALRRYAGVDPHRASIEALRSAALERGVHAPESLAAADRDGWLNLLLATVVEPQLGQTRPVILFDYPASQAALAVVREGDPPLAERFELYARGIELANGYHELVDAAVLRRRSALANEHRQRDGKPELPNDSRLLAAMDAGLPACSGVALGFDRLVMIAAGATSLAEVIAFPIDRA